MSTTFNDDVLIDSADLEVVGDIAVTADPANLGTETYAQPTFTPSHTKWAVDGDFSFVGDVPTYAASAGSGNLWQEPEDLAIPMVNSLYRFEWTRQNVTAGDLVCQIWGNSLLATIAVVNGASSVDFQFLGGYPPYAYCEGTSGGFEIVSVSLKEITGGKVQVESTVSASAVTATQLLVEGTSRGTRLVQEGTVFYLESRDTATRSIAINNDNKAIGIYGGGWGLSTVTVYGQNDSWTTSQIIADSTMSSDTTDLKTASAFTVNARYVPTAGGSQTAVDISLKNAPSSNPNTLTGLNIGVSDSGSLANTVIGLSVNTGTGNANDTTYAAIFQGGNVGIGTTSPSSPLDINGDTVRIRTAKTPSSATAAGNQGDFAWDANYLYICTASNTWRRVAHSTW
jgi:hypothetical protein